MCQKATKMATLVSQITTAFADDTVAPTTGTGLHVATGPIDRIANAGEVAEPRATSRTGSGGSKHKVMSNRRGRLWRCLSFRYLSDLT